MKPERLMRELLPKLVKADFSKPLGGDLVRVGVRPVTIKSLRSYQFESIRGTQAFHRNLGEAEAVREMVDLLKGFRSLRIQAEDRDIRILDGKLEESPAQRAPAAAGHDRPKEHLLKEGVPVPFLARLGVMSADGRVLAPKRDKFRQINRYLEIVDDVVADLPEGPLRVVDFGCGKSYLTFALHHLLRTLRGRQAEIVGLDLKAEVVADCAAIASDLGLEGLRFEAGDIAGFRGFDRADLVVSLHACDTATDEAIARAVAWKASAILAVPCCQHEVPPRIRNAVHVPLLRHGILRERLGSLLTDAMRAELLETAGYAVQVIEFVDTEHTPKNLMIRARRREGRGRDRSAYRALREAWGAGPSLERLI